MAKNQHVSFQKAMELVTAVINLAKSFQGFKIPQSIKDELKSAMQAMTDKGDQQAARILLNVEKGFHALLSAFFRNSPKFFTARIEELREDGCEKDILARLEKHLQEIVALGKVSESVDLIQGQTLYAEMFSLLGWAEEEMKQRVAKRREAQLAAEARQAEEQRQLEMHRRQEKALAIGELVASI